MKIIKPSVEILEQEPGLIGVYKQIEVAGRTCYKSEDKITDTSAEAFVKARIDTGHTAMLEHGTVYLEFSLVNKTDDELKHIYNEIDFFDRQPNSLVVIGAGRWSFVTTNYRVLLENNSLDLLDNICEPTQYHPKRTSVRFICDRGVSHELVRHRVFSFAQESTRYCNYGKDKFDNNISIICPVNPYEEEFKSDWDNNNLRISKLRPAWSEWVKSQKLIEKTYLRMVDNGLYGIQPQIARSILPTSLKTEVIMTGFDDDWQGRIIVYQKDNNYLMVECIPYTKKNMERCSEIYADKSRWAIVVNGFFPLRTAPSAHPQMQELAIPLKEMFIKAGKIEE